MNINHHIRSLQIVYEGTGHLLRHCPLRIAGENTVHVQIETGNSPCNGINAQGIQCRINLQRTIQFIQILLHNLIQPEADILAFQFITVCTGYDTNTFARISVTNYILLD